MYRQIQIRQKQGTKSPQDRLEMVFKKPNGEVWVYTRNKQLVQKNKMLPGDEAMMLTIGRLNPSFNLRYEDDPMYTDTQNDTFKQLTELLPYQRTVLVVDGMNPDGTYKYSDKTNPNLAIHLFDLIDQTAIHIQNVVELKNIIRAMNIVNAMTPVQMAEVMYHYGYGQNAIGRKPSELLMYLIDPNAGLVLKRERYDTKIVDGREVSRSYLEYFVDRYTTQDEDVKLQTLVLKALIVKKADKTNIIEKKSTGHHFLNENNLGLSIHDVVNHLKRNKKDLEYVMDQVMRNDNVVEDDIPILLKKKGITEEKGVVTEVSRHDLKQTEYFGEQQKLLARCRNVFKMTVSDEESLEQLEKKADEAKVLFYRAQFLGLKPTIEANPEWSYERIQAEVQKANDAHQKAMHEKREAKKAATTKRKEEKLRKSKELAEA